MSSYDLFSGSLKSMISSSINGLAVPREYSNSIAKEEILAIVVTVVLSSLLGESTGTHCDCVTSHGGDCITSPVAELLPALNLFEDQSELGL
jgi:hypothetical protein